MCAQGRFRLLIVKEAVCFTTEFAHLFLSSGLFNRPWQSIIMLSSTNPAGMRKVAVDRVFDFEFGVMCLFCAAIYVGMFIHNIHSLQLHDC
jgi:hypothetical protein